MAKGELFGVNNLIKEWDRYMLKGLPKPVIIIFKKKYDHKRLDFIHKIVGKHKPYYLGKDSKLGVIVKIDSLSHLKEIKRRLIEEERNYVNYIKGVEKYLPEITKDREHEEYKIRMLNFNDSRENEEVVREVKKQMENLGVSYRDRDFGVFRYIEIRREDIDKVGFLKNTPIKSVKPVYEVELM